MSKVKDGYWKAISSKIGSNDYLLKAAGGYIGVGNSPGQVVPLNNSTLNSGLNADLLDGLHSSSFSLTSHTHDDRYLKYSGWWTSGNGNNADNANGMVFAYANHNVPIGWGILTTFDYQYNSNYKMQLFSYGYSNGYTYYRNKSADRGGWNAWVRFLDSTNYTEYVYNKSTADGRYLSKVSNDSTSYQYEFTKTNDHAIKVGTIRGRAVGSRTGEYIHLYERVHIGSPNGWGSNDAPSYGLSTYGGAWLATDAGNVGIGTTSPSYKLDVNGNTRISGNLYLGANASNNFITFYGNTGDAPGSYQTSFIGEHLWGGGESTELLLMKFNDVGNGTDATTAYSSGPDRIRHLAHGHVFQIMTDTSQGDFVTMANSTAVETKFDIARNRINSYVPILQQCYNSWLSPARVQIGRMDTSSYSDRSCIGTTDGNLHIDPYSGHSLYLNYYCNATTYFNGSSYWIDTSGKSNMSISHLLINGSTWWSNWYWSGQSGQPTWLWGSNDGTNMYVWNPSNFSVNYANSAGQLSTTRYIYGNAFNGTQNVSGNLTLSTGDQINFQDPNNDGVAFNYNNNKSSASSIRIYNGRMSEIARFTTSGYFGIGTSSPSYRLHVIDDTYTSGYSRANSGFIKSGSSDSYVLLGGGGHKAESSLSVSNADTVDGYHASSFSLTSHKHSDLNFYSDSQNNINNFVGFETFRYSKRIVDGTEDLFLHDVGNNANSVFYIPTSATMWGTQVGFNSNAEMFLRAYSGSSLSGVGWKMVINSSNYTDYTVTKTGTGATGTWGINITGNANRLSQTSISSLSSFVHSSDLIYAAAGGSNSVADKPSGVDAFGVLSYKTASGWYGQILTSSNTARGIYWRTGTSFSNGWKKILDSTNYTDYTVTKTGTGATGNWSISITGNAATATSLQGGAKGSIPYQSAASTTTFLSIGSSGQILSVENGIPVWKDNTSNGVITITKSLKVTEEWMDSGIKSGSADSASSSTLSPGTWLVQISHGTLNSGTDSWAAVYSGIMSLYHSTNSTNVDDSDEIVLHRSGHASGKRLYLRTMPTESANGFTKLQIAASAAFSTAGNLTFRFKKIFTI